MTELRVGVVGAGRVGAVLAAALRATGHEIVAVAGESDASRGRIEALLPGVVIDKPSAVARAADLLLLTVPDDSLPNVVAMLAASGALELLAPARDADIGIAASSSYTPVDGMGWRCWPRRGQLARERSRCTRR